MWRVVEEMKRKIGIMGGTFNPIHNAHLLMAERAYEEYELDQVIFLPSRKPAYKDERELASEASRKQMIEYAIADKEYFSISTMEYEREGNTYTVDTMEALHRNSKDTEFYFLIGADSLLYLEDWNRAERLFELTRFLVAFRGENKREQLEPVAEHLRNTYHAKIDFLHMPIMEISSTDIRARRKQGKSVAYLLPKAVEDYITVQGLYL